MLFLFSELLYLDWEGQPASALILRDWKLDTEFTCFHSHNDIYKNNCYLMSRMRYFKTARNSNPKEALWILKN